MYHRLKAIAASLRIPDSPLATQVIATRSLELTWNQVTLSSLFTRPPPFTDRSCDFRFPNNIHQKLNFPSKPISFIVDLVLTNDWSQGLEHELEKCCPSLTHETVIYVLKKLNKNPEKASCFFNWASQTQWWPSSSVRGLILRVLANNSTREQFWATLGVMLKNGVFLDKETYLGILAGFNRENMTNDSVALKNLYNRMYKENARGSGVVVTKVVGIISGSDWGNEVTNKLAKLKIPRSDNFVVRVLRELRNCPLEAFEFFRWVGKQPGYEHGTVTYNAIARVLARNDSIKEFWTILEEMKSVGLELDIDTYGKVSRQLQRNKMMMDAVKLYELMMDGLYEPSVQDCTLLIKSISESDLPDLDLVSRVAKKYESTGHTLSKEIYDGIHRSMIGAGKFEEAENIVQTMRNAGYEPDNITYSQVVFGLCKTRRLEEAWKVLEEMELCGCIPDVKTWTILIQGHCAADEVDKALLCVDKMIEKGCDADAVVLGSLVDSLLGQKTVEDAYKLLVDITSKCGTSPWHLSYRKLIEDLIGSGKFEEALGLLCLMRKHKYLPVIEPFVQYISKFGTVEDANKFLKAWSKGSPRSHSAYLHVFESFFREGRESEARDLLSKCRPHMRRRKAIRELFDSAKNRSDAT